jgi:hypothetical protein
MCACKETDVRESPNDSTFAGGERQGSQETCYATFDEIPVSSLPERVVSFFMRKVPCLWKSCSKRETEANSNTQRWRFITSFCIYTSGLDGQSLGLFLYLLFSTIKEYVYIHIL